VAELDNRLLQARAGVPAASRAGLASRTRRRNRRHGYDPLEATGFFTAPTFFSRNQWSKSVHPRILQSQANPGRTPFSHVQSNRVEINCVTPLIGCQNSNGYGPERAGLVLDWPNAASISPGEPFGKRFSNAAG
jgi:hypothetical protein